MRDEDRDKFDRQITRPVEGSASSQVSIASGPWSREAEMAQFKRG